MEQEIRFIDFEGRRLAYATYGEGPPMVIGPRWVSHLEEEWADPNQRAFYAELAKTHRVIRFDRIGCGLSSRELDPRPTIESESRQLEAVIDAVGGPRGRLRIVVLLPLRLAARGAPARRRREARLLRRLRVTQRHSRGDARLADPVHRASNWKLAAQMLAGLFDPHASGDEIAEHTRMQRAAASAEAASIFLELDLDRRPARVLPKSLSRRSSCIAAATAPCRSAAAASSRRCCRTRASSR